YCWRTSPDLEPRRDVSRCRRNPIIWNRRVRMTPRRTQTIRTTRELAHAIVSLPAPGPLPQRTVLVPNGRIAHALRREILAIGRPDALAGTLFSTPPLAAHEILTARGATVLLGEERVRPLRLLALFRGEPRFEYFEP